MKSTDASRYVWTLTEVFYVIVMKISSWLMIRSAVYLSNLLSRTTIRFRRLVSYIRGPNNWVSWRTDDHGFLSANKVKHHVWQSEEMETERPFHNTSMSVPRAKMTQQPLPKTLPQRHKIQCLAQRYELLYKVAWDL